MLSLLVGKKLLTAQGDLLLVAVLEALYLYKATFFEFLAVVGGILRVYFLTRKLIPLLGAGIARVELLAEVAIREVCSGRLLSFLTDHLIQVEQNLILLLLVKLLQHQ